MDERYKLMAPGLIDQPWSEAQALGAGVWLWMNSPMHRVMPLDALNALLLPAIKRQQFVIASENGQPVFYMAWACFDELAERRYIDHRPEDLAPADWASGDRLWILDWIAPFGHSREMTRLVSRDLFPRRWGRSLYHRGRQRGLRVLTFRGAAVLPEEARLWFDANPVLARQPRAQVTTAGLRSSPVSK